MIAPINSPAGLKLSPLVIEDNSYTPPASATGSLADIQSSLSKNSAAEIAVAEFLQLTRSRFGFGPAANLLVEYVNLSPDNG